MTYKVIDNFLQKDQYFHLKNLITNFEFPWRRRLQSLCQDGHPSNNGYFTFLFYTIFYQPQSEWFEHFIVPILDKLKAASVYSSKSKYAYERIIWS
jgi:hypothetical protein